MVWKSTIVFVWVSILALQTSFAQSLLSTPVWIEQQQQSRPLLTQGPLLVPDMDSHSLNGSSEKSTLTCRSMDSQRFGIFRNPTPQPHPHQAEPFSLALLQEKLSVDPQQVLRDWVQHRNLLHPIEGLILELQIMDRLQQYQTVETLAQRFMDQFPDSPYFVWSYYFYQKSRSKQHKPVGDEIDLDPPTLAQLPAQYQTDLFQIFESDAWNRRAALPALRLLLELSETSKSTGLTNKITRRLLTTKDLDLLAFLEAEYAHLDFVQQEFPYIRLQLLLEDKKYLQALEVIHGLLSSVQTYRIPGKLDHLTQLQRQINTALYVNPRKIGVILPLSASIAQMAQLTQETLEGLRLALLKEKSSAPSTDQTLVEESQVPIELIFRDSLLNAEATQNAVRELVEDEQVIAIIGPLIRLTSEAAAQEAQRLKVPLISLSLTPEIPEQGSYVFRNNQSWEQEMRALARYAVDYKHAKRFLILHPDSKEGQNKTAFFWDEVERLGGAVHGGVNFKRGQKNFVRQFESLTGMNRYISEEERALMEAFDEKQQPNQEFDAIFIPVGNRGLRELRVLLPYSAVYKMSDTLFLGDRGWNNKSAVSILDKYLKEAIFVDSFFKENSQPHVEEFVALHERYFLKHLNYQGPGIYSAYAYDTVNILKNLLANPMHHTHETLKDALLDMSPFSGVTGVTTFLSNGESHREMKLLTVRNKTIVPVD